MKKILVPTDFSSLSENALKLATDVGRHTQAEIYLVHFMDHPFSDNFSTLGDTSGEKVSEEDVFTLQLAKKNHSRLSEQAKKYGLSVKINYQVYPEEFKDGFKEYIEKKSIDLVVLGTTGEESGLEFFTGNHAEQLIEGATCPVITVKGNYKESTFQNIMVGIDLHHDDQDNFVQAAAYINEFSTAMLGKVSLLHVADLNSDKEGAEQKVKAFAQKYGFKNADVVVTQNNDKEQGLFAYAFAKKADLIVVLSHKEGGFFRFLEDSTAEELTKNSSIPVMVINLHNI